MTHNQNHHHARTDGPHSLPVRFVFTDPEAVSVYIACTFHNWQPDAKPMHPGGNSRWIREIVLPIGKTRIYCLVGNGKFRRDPRARESLPKPVRWCEFHFESDGAGGTGPVLAQELLQKNWRNK